MAMGAHDLAFEAESSVVASPCSAAEEERCQWFNLPTEAVMKININTEGYSFFFNKDEGYRV